MAPKPKLVDDPNTFIPPAVRRMAEQADAAFRAQSGQPEQPPGESPPPKPPGAPEPPPGDRPPPEVTREVTPPLRAEAAPPAETPADEESWERRYNGILGRYKRQENDVRGMSEQIASMQNLIASMQRPAETPAELRPQSLLTPEEVSEYGQEFLGVVARRAKEELNPEVNALRQKLTSLEKQLATTAEQNTTRERFQMEALLDQRLPQWRDINYMEEFKQWLALPDTYSGAIRHELLKTAYAQNNTPRVLAFFKGFLDQEAAFVPRGGEPHQVAELQNGGKVPLESFARTGQSQDFSGQHGPC